MKILIAAVLPFFNRRCNGICSEIWKRHCQYNGPNTVIIVVQRPEIDVITVLNKWRKFTRKQTFWILFRQTFGIVVQGINRNRWSALIKNVRLWTKQINHINSRIVQKDESLPSIVHDIWKSAQAPICLNVIKLARKCVYCKQGVGEVEDGVGREVYCRTNMWLPTSPHHLPPKKKKKKKNPKTRESVNERNIVKMDGCFWINDSH